MENIENIALEHEKLREKKLRDVLQEREGAIFSQVLNNF